MDSVPSTTLLMIEKANTKSLYNVNKMLRKEKRKKIGINLVKDDFAFSVGV